MISKLRKICVITGTRADYGLVYWILKDLEAASGTDLQLVAAAMHLAPEFGHTVDLIRKDGFSVDGEVAMLEPENTPAGIARSLGRGVIGFSDAFEKLQPDIVVLLGDRFEMLAAAGAATSMLIPIAHIHGGEITEGAIDNAFRHAITKMAHFHFVAAPAYRDRVIQMGEAPDHVYVVGAPGLDNLERLKIPNRDQLFERLEIDPSRQVFLVTYHPATLDEKNPIEALEELLAALDEFPDVSVIITKANADAGGRAINDRLESYATSCSGRVHFATTLGQVNYLGALMAADVIIGNSSSGIIEAPASGTPTVNLGIRQAGRLRAGSIIDCDEKKEAIVTAINKALSTDFMAEAGNKEPPYGRSSGASEKITKILGEVELDGILIKSFYNLGSHGR